ncbi:unnamed protein product [Rotaria sp. Silwood2]|nr:unnamed protein product [Rotaria sp. Silwood2]CAF3116828.1 unnamed protein product [Rotaria sp. Silwood2]CAF4429987.1 unnamed protein product [Rotaria sp. Silwood2]CAF4480922.1 unnamed protein product [Rotaria sp. Silwood2]
MHADTLIFNASSVIRTLSLKNSLQCIGHLWNRPSKANITSKYAKTLLDVAGADGLLTDAERKWIIGYAATRGVKQEELDVPKGYKLGSEDSTAIFNNDSK